CRRRSGCGRPAAASRDQDGGRPGRSPAARGCATAEAHPERRDTMSITERLRGAVAPGAPAASVVDRAEALRRVLRAAEDPLPAPRLATARTVVDRAGERLRRSRTHSVVALAGATGSGKSSLFNVLAGLELSRVGVRRPTTGVAHACIWGREKATELLDWLGVPPNRRFYRESALDGDDEQTLRGLVLLDLP